jgi:hypothetical protein
MHCWNSYKSNFLFAIFIGNGIFQIQLQKLNCKRKTFSIHKLYLPLQNLCRLFYLLLYNFRGDLVEIEDDIESLDTKSFDDRLASVDIEGNCCREIFVDENFTGESMTFRGSGRFPSAVDLQKIFQKASSVKMC